MNAEVINAMKQILSNHGVDILLNRKILRSYLADYLKNQFVGEINLIICCLNEKIPQKIINNNNDLNTFIEQNSTFISKNIFLVKNM